MPRVQDLLRSGGEQTLRLATDVAAPLVVGVQRLGGRLGIGAGSGLTRAQSGGVSVRGAARVLALIGLGLGLGVGTGVTLLYLNGSPTVVQASGSPATEPLPAGPVKIVDAAPRGASCEEQVWPYIEQRCLRRAPGSPPAAAEVSRPVEPAVPPPEQAAAMKDAPADASAPAVVVSTDTTSIAPSTAAPEPAPSATEVDANGAPVQRRAAVASAMDGATLADAGAAAGMMAWQFAQTERRAEPRRRTARRAYSRRPAFSFRVFGLRF